MHLVPESGGSRVVDPDGVCVAVSALRDETRVRRWADLLAVLGEQHRLSILVSLCRAGELCVSDLALAVGMSESAVSHALRLLRAHGLVTVRREGRLAHYRLDDDTASAVLRLVEATLPPALVHGHGERPRVVAH